MSAMGPKLRQNMAMYGLLAATTDGVLSIVRVMRSYNRYVLCCCGIRARL